MKTIQSVYDQSAVAHPVSALRPDVGELRPGLTWLLAAVAGLGVAALYYTQPMLAVMAADLRVAPAALGAVPMLTQLGYAAGILFLAPLGDRFDRKRIILLKAAVLAAALVVAALARSLAVLWLASFVLGLAATLAQDVVSSTAALAPERGRGRAVGSVMTGLLLGILLSRAVGGLVAQHFGWRAMLGLAALGVVAAMAPVWRFLPSPRVTTRLPYGELLRSLGGLWRTHAALRRAAWTQGLLAVGFSAFWSTLALMLGGEPFRLGSAAAGAFGLAGAVGALAAPLAGRLADKRGPARVTRLCSALAAVSFAGLLGAAWLEPRAQLAAMVLGVVGFDLGVQATLIGHQTIIYGLDPAARSRLNAVLISAMFVGMSLGAGLGGVLLQSAGWPGVMALATLSSAAAFVLRTRERSAP